MIDLHVRAVDDPIRSDQYRYVSTHAWSLSTQAFLAGRTGSPVTRYVSLVEHRSEQWIPADPDREWLLERHGTGRRRWLLGTAEQAIADGVDLDEHNPLEGRHLAAYGDFSALPAGRRPAPRPGCWQVPDAEFLAGLPRDPGTLLARLRADSPQRRPSGPFTCAADALRTCRVPADLRTVLYRVLCRLPEVTGHADATDLDGRACLALVGEVPGGHRELLIDPADGQYAGERRTLTAESRSGLPAGTVTSSSSVRTAVVDAPGEAPPALPVRPRDGVPR